MRLIYRRLLLMFSVLVFIGVTPFIVLYAIGYRYSTGAPKPVSVGVILLSSLPRAAEVWINKEYLGKTPRAIANILPGRTPVRVHRDGYSDWAKQLPVEPAKATIINTIRLFPTTPHVTQLATTVALFELSPDQKLIAMIDVKNKISVLDREGAVVVAPVPLKSRTEAVVWSPDSSAVLLHAGSRYNVLPIASLGKLTALPALSGALSVVWDPRAPGRLLALMPDHTLTAAHITATGLTKLASDIESFAVGGRFAYLVTLAGQIRKIDFQGQVIDNLSAIPNNKAVTLRVSSKDQLAVLTTDQSVWLQASDSNWHQIRQHALDALWSPSGQMLLIQTAPTELFVYTTSDQFQYLAAGQAQLITRLSRPMNHLAWFASDSHVLYQVDDQIVVGEIDSRDNAIQTTLDTTNTGNAMAAVGKDSETIYYVKKSGGQTALVKADLTIVE